jgi:hypothetical protein
VPKNAQTLPGELAAAHAIPLSLTAPGSVAPLQRWPFHCRRPAR